CLLFICFIVTAIVLILFFFFQAEDGIRDFHVIGVQTCALPISSPPSAPARAPSRPASPPPRLRARFRPRRGGGAAPAPDRRAGRPRARNLARRRPGC